MRKGKGSAITELGPALILLVLFVVVPILDLAYLIAAYGFSFFVHNTEIRELATNTPWQIDGGAAAQAALSRADNDFINNSGGMAAFLGITSINLTTKIQHPNFGAGSFVPGATPAQPGTVILTTAVHVRPWLYVPVLKGVPGIGSDMVFTFTSSKPEDEDGRN